MRSILFIIVLVVAIWALKEREIYKIELNKYKSCCNNLKKNLGGLK